MCRNVKALRHVAALRSGIWPLSYVTVDAWTLFFSLVLISIACIIMGADAAPALLSFRVWLSPGFSHDEA